MSFKKLKLMIIDDSQVSLNYFSTILQDDLNLEIIKLKNSQEALTLALQERPDIILTDLEMPVLDGLELIKTFKNTIDFKYTPIVVLSANTSDKKIIKAIELGAYDFLQKDLNPLIIKTKIFNIIQILSLQEFQKRSSQLSILNHFIELSNHEINNSLFISNGKLKKLKKQNASDKNIELINELIDVNKRIENHVKKLSLIKNIDLDNIENYEKEINYLKINY